MNSNSWSSLSLENILFIELVRNKRRKLRKSINLRSFAFQKLSAWFSLRFPPPCFCVMHILFWWWCQWQMTVGHQPVVAWHHASTSASLHIDKERTWLQSDLNIEQLPLTPPLIASFCWKPDTFKLFVSFLNQNKNLLLSSCKPCQIKSPERKRWKY